MVDASKVTTPTGCQSHRRTSRVILFAMFAPSHLRAHPRQRTSTPHKHTPTPHERTRERAIEALRARREAFDATRHEPGTDPIDLIDDAQALEAAEALVDMLEDGTRERSASR